MLLSKDNQTRQEKKEGLLPLYTTIRIPFRIKTALIEMAEQVITQDNRITARPYYYVVRRPVEKFSADVSRTGWEAKLVIYFDTETYTPQAWVEDMSDNGKDFWVNSDGEYLLDDEGKPIDDMDFMEKVEEEEDDTGSREFLWVWFADEDYKDCGTFLTETAAQQFIDCNRHHVGPKAFTYVRHSWRNSDAKLLQEFLECLYNSKSAEV